MLELSEKELLNPERNKNEDQGQYKSRRRFTNMTLALYRQTGTKGVTESYFEFVRLCLKLGKK